MPRKELIIELRIRQKELIEELTHIDSILKSNTVVGHTAPSKDTNLILINEPSANGVPAKGDMSWIEYSTTVLSAIGGKGKVREVADAAIKANPGSDPDRIHKAIRHHLSALGKMGDIDVEPGRIKSEGNIYVIKGHK